MDACGWEQLRPWLGARAEGAAGGAAVSAPSTAPPAGGSWASAPGYAARLRRLAAPTGVRRRSHRVSCSPRARARARPRGPVPLNVIQRPLGHTNLGTTSQGRDGARCQRCRRSVTQTALRTRYVDGQRNRFWGGPGAAMPPGLPDLCDGRGRGRTPACHREQRVAARAANQVSATPREPQRRSAPQPRSPRQRLEPGAWTAGSSEPRPGGPAFAQSAHRPDLDPPGNGLGDPPDPCPRSPHPQDSLAPDRRSEHDLVAAGTGNASPAHIQRGRSSRHARPVPADRAG